MNEHEFVCLKAISAQNQMKEMEVLINDLDQLYDAHRAKDPDRFVEVFFRLMTEAINRRDELKEQIKETDKAIINMAQKLKA